ncbi:MAG: AAA family ATPase [Gammaproteobacteria bacterium]|nr:AAA family ATPase [Gammaproteobacteria bacterium]
MVELEGYTAFEEISAQEHTVCYRAIRVSDHKQVILKIIRSEYPTVAELSSLQQDYQFAKKLNIPGIIKAYDFQKYRNGYGLVLEDIGGITLKEYLQLGILSLTNFFRIALPLVDTLQALHEKGVIHKDINPTNIIIEPQTLSVKLTDFSNASLLQYEVQDQQNPNILSGTLFYLSPEQTGRMNRSIDYRTDFYSLGVTFYEMLAGQLPFAAIDAIGWVYCHIAQPPTPLQNIAPEIPEMISRIIHKLIGKMPEDRYKSAAGLKSDLLQCEIEWRGYGVIKPFELALNDVSDTLALSQRLYGREMQVNALLDAFDRTIAGGRECILISGNAGIGKSSLVHEIDKPITKNKGFFISGKYDQFKRNIPFSAVIEAFRQLVQNWLTEPEEKIIVLRNELQNLVGKSGQVLIDIIPELEHIIGPQPKALTLDPTQTQNRFMILFRGFIQVFASKNHPLVLFLDDLQWVDNGSLKLIEMLLTDPQIRYLLVIGSYRDNEVTADHPLLINLREINKSNITTIKTIDLAPLNVKDLTDLIFDSINGEYLRDEQLANLVFKKTGGNPFFVIKFLKTLYQEKLLTFSHINRSWEWNIEAVEAAKITESIVGLLISNIHKLSPAAQMMLQRASCIGFTFDLGLLAILSGETLQKTSILLWEAVQAELISPIGTNYRDVDLFAREKINPKNIQERINYNFSHDRIQHAVMSLNTEDNNQKMHFAIGKILLGKYNEQSESVDLFEIINHLNASSSLIRAEAEKIQLAELNLKGAKQARLSMAYQSALNYINAGIQLLVDISWDQQYELLLALHKQLLECEYLIGEYQKAEQNFDFIMSKAKTVLDKADLYYSKIKIYTNQGKLHEGTQLGIEALRLFDIEIPTHPNVGTILRKILSVERLIFFKNVSQLNVVEMTDPKQLSILRILFAIGTSASSFNRPLFLVTTCMATRQVLEYGYTDEAPLAICAYAMLLLSIGRHKKAVIFLDFARRISEKSGSVAASARYHIPVILANYLYKPIHTLPDIAKIAYQQALEAGELIYASWACVGKLRALSLLGKPIKDLGEEALNSYEYTLRIKYTDYYDITKMYNQYYQCLQANPAVSREDLLESLKGIQSKESEIINGEGHSLAARYYYFVEDYENALKMSEKAFAYRQSYHHHQMIRSEVYLYYALAIAKNYPQLNIKQRKSYKKIYKKILNEVQRWSKLCPYNFSDKYLLLAAEYAQICNRSVMAARLYDDAINQASKNNFIYCIAIANDCAAQFYSKQGKDKIARSYMLEAHYYFYRWGAVAKTNLLEHQYQAWLKPQMNSNAIAHDHSGTITLPTSALDFLSVIKASHTISKEILPDRLLLQTLNVVIENAGADKAMFITRQNTSFIIELAIDKISEDPDKFIRKEGNATNLPQTLLHAVYRTNKPIILYDAINSEIFANDSYIIKNRPKSILCMPIHHQNDLVGILYLENHTSTGAFTSELLQVLNLIGTQTAISLENAKVYAASGRFVPREFLEQLQKRNISEVSLGDNSHQNMSILFCDIRNFSNLFEHLTSAEAFDLINSFFSAMEPYIRKQHGFIDKYIGDAIMALFSGVADHAVQAGVDMLKGLKKYQEACKINNKPEINIGIGINTGELMLGIVGSENRIESTVIGDSVNIATRIETLNKLYGTKLLISETTRLNLRFPEHFTLRLVDKAIIKGKENTIEVWEVCDVDEPDVLEAKRKSLDCFNRARNAYQEKNYMEAQQYFRMCHDQNKKDQVVKIYLDLCKKKLS